ncbi:DUF3231 family protein [Neobacillus sp. MM2021_6]|uniref:DUF3231 family protein n=1 Tax=Bacillaceae TaxID=186817 RepID=UPI00140C40A9|nr:DUF3231 family protein [Neobacillus sp. MM2021_6]NHC17711.1 DUF3231 family protein [Bacillus sp. MM2020_4]
MAVHNSRLSSAEIGGLWTTYLQENMAVCLITYFLHHNQDEEVKKILRHAFEISDGHVKQITTIFTEEGIPIPDGFTEKDLDLTVPPLFYDMFGLSFIYSMSRMSMISAGFITASIVRKDIQELFVKMTQEFSLLYKESTTVMLSKGIYDRPPMIPYPKEVEYVEKLSYLSGFGKKRPLNVAEITEIFFNTKRNYFSILLCMGLLQVVKDKEIHSYIEEGKKISEKQIKTFNDIFMKEELLGNISTNMEVTDSTVSPFSDRLVVTLFHSLNAIDITLIGHALSLSMRTDLTAYYQKYIVDILVYSAKGFDILVDRGWAQEPPHAPSRRDLQRLK